MARNDISFKNVGIPQLGGNASLFSTGVDSVNKGLAAFKGIVDDQQASQDQQQQLKQDLSLDQLRAFADKELGGPQAGETLEDYNTAIDGFLADNGELTKVVGQKGVNQFKTGFEKFLEEDRNKQESRDITLEDRRRSKVTYDRAEAAFGRQEETREANNAARLIVKNHVQARKDVRARMLEPGYVLTAQDLAMLGTDSNLNILRDSMGGLVKADPSFTGSLLNNEITAQTTIHLSPAERTALATKQKNEERVYQEALKGMEFRNEQIKNRISKLSDVIALEPGDVVGGVRRFSEGLAALTGENADIKVGDDVLLEAQEIMTQLVSEGHNPEDVATALLASTEVAEDILFFRVDEDIDRDRLATNLQFAKNAREAQIKTRGMLEVLGQQGVTPAAPITPAATTTAVPDPVTTAPPPPAAAASVTDQVAALSAEAAALEPGQPESGLTQAEEAKALQINADVTDATSPKELKLIAINQLTRTELPQVQANMEAALEKLPSQKTATDAESILRRELIVKLGALNKRINSFQEPEPPSEADIRDVPPLVLPPERG